MMKIDLLICLRKMVCCAKKKVMQEFHLDESLMWSQGEDCIWSMKVLSKYNFSMNANSTVHFDKMKADAFGLFRPEVLEKCIKYINGIK